MIWVRHSSRQSGNILFLILLAVVLFAALAYAVTSSMRGGGRDAGAETAQVTAARILQHFQLIEQTMMRAMLVDNVPEYGFDVSGATSSNAGANSTCTTSACKLYTERGGTIPPLTLPENAWTTTSASQRRATFYVAQVLNVGTQAPEVLINHSYLTKSVCEAYNTLAGASELDVEAADTLGGANYSYTGAMTEMPASTAVFGDNVPLIKGKKAFCHLTGSGNYRALYVLMER